jgi:YVTN family beta-propeller protein
MRQICFTFILLLTFNVAALGQYPANSRSTSLAYVFDPGQQSVTAIDLLSGNKIATALVSDSGDVSRDQLVLTPDGSKLVMLVAGAQKFLNDYGEHQPDTTSTAIVIDTKTMKPAQPISLGWHLSKYSFTPDNKILIAISSGFKSTKSAKTLPGEIVTVDLSSGQVLAQIPVQQPVTDCLITRDGKTAILFFAKQILKDNSSPAELQFISLEKQAAIGKITLDGDPEMPIFSPTGEFIYLVEKGRPSHNPRKNINGRIHVVSLKEMKVAAILDAGSGPKIALPDDEAGKTLILSDGPPVQTNDNQIVDAELRVLRGASIETVLKVGNGPRYLSFSPDRKRLYVTSAIDYYAYPGVSADYRIDTRPASYYSVKREFAYRTYDLLTVIDYTSFKVLGQINLDGVVSPVVFTPDGSRGFTLDPKSSRMLPLDLQAMKPGTAISTGRNGVKAEHFIIGSVEASASMFFPLAAIAFATSNYYLYSPAITLMSVRPDGAFVYVLNLSTHDVTVVNTSNSSVVTKITAGGRRLQPLEGGGILAVIDHDSIHRIATSSQKELPEIHFKSKLIDFTLTPDGHIAVALVDGSVVLLDGSTGELRSRIDGFNRPQKIVFAQTGQATEAAH